MEVGHVLVNPNEMVGIGDNAVRFYEIGTGETVCFAGIIGGDIRVFTNKPVKAMLLALAMEQMKTIWPRAFQ